MIGLSGVGSPGTIFLPLGGTSMCVSALTRLLFCSWKEEPTAEAIAAVLIEGFDRHYRLFRETSAQAKERFERAAWAEAQLAVQERIRFYDERVRENVEQLRAEFDLDALDAAAWREVKLRFIGLLVDHHQPELAETFFNSVITRDPPAHLLGQRPDLRPRDDLDRADRLRPADLPQLLPRPERSPRLLRPRLPRLRLDRSLRRPRA